MKKTCHILFLATTSLLSVLAWAQRQ